MAYQQRCVALIDKCIQMVNQFSYQEELEKQAIKWNIPELIKDLILSRLRLVEPGCIGNRNIYKHQNLRLTIYRLACPTVMRLHDHPNMHVLTYIIEGSILASIYNLNPETGLYQRSQVRLEENQMTSLNPSQNNFHQFETTDSSCMFMDIIFPDYNNGERKFTQYEAFMEDSGEFKLVPSRDDQEIPFVDI